MKKALLFCIVVFLFGVSSAAGEEFVISHFDKRANELGGASSVYQQAPSRASVTLSSETSQDPGGKSLKLFYDKKGAGGPHGKGGWCGFYTLLKDQDRFFDASQFKTLHFWVKGEKGDENFKVGVADRHWDGIGDSVKSDPIGTYLPSGKITTEWQRASIPLDQFFVDLSEVASIAICFETELFSDGAGTGTVYVDEMVFE